eukprot:10522278-Prorocentrum_lima.AAC.1
MENVLWFCLASHTAGGYRMGMEAAAAANSMRASPVCQHTHKDGAACGTALDSTDEEVHCK